MKKIVRFTAIICFLCIMITTLSGCDFGHDKIQENIDGSLTFLGKRYIKLEKSDDVYFKYDYSNDGYYISKEDESWFSEFFDDSDYCEVSKDKYFIENFDGEIYCREDKYKSVVERTENGFEPEKYLYTYDESNGASGLFYLGWTEKEYYLTDSDLEMVNNILKEIIPIENGSHMSENSECWVEVYGCSDDLLLRKLVFTVLEINGKYYLEIKDEYFNPFVYEVPDIYNDKIEKMIEKYLENY